MNESRRYAYFDGRFVPFEDAKVSVMTHALSYGTGVFEGIEPTGMRIKIASTWFSCGAFPTLHSKHAHDVHPRSSQCGRAMQPHRPLA